MRATEALDRVDELRAQGLINQIDFMWKYNRDREGLNIIHSCEFMFKDPKLATFYSLKWNKQR